MRLPDLKVAKRFLEARPPRGGVVLCAITGSHHYGFPSPDSDIDIKGIHLAPTRTCLGLGHPQETHDRLEVFDGIECDLTTHEAKKAIGLMLRGNGNILERIFSPFQLLPGPGVDALRELAKGSLSKRCLGHYRGYFRGMQREHTKVAQTAKTMLYTYRVALTGVHLLRTGVVVADLGLLAPEYGFDEVLQLIERKCATREKVGLPDAESMHFQGGWARLEEALEEALLASQLPDEPGNEAACEAWLVDQRLALLAREGR